MDHQRGDADAGSGGASKTHDAIQFVQEPRRRHSLAECATACLGVKDGRFLSRAEVRENERHQMVEAS